MSTEERPFQSKKFLAYLVAELSWKVIMGLVLFWGKDTIPEQVFIIMLTIVLVAGFGEALYIGGQAALDKYIRVAQIASQNGKSFSIKGLQVTGSHQPPPSPPVVPEDKPKSIG